jgi:signal transduction histidine kinase
MALALLGGVGTMLLVPEVVLPVSGLFAIWSLAASRPPRISLLGLAGLVALSAANFVTATVDDATFTIALAGGVWALGEAARNRRVAIQQEARRAVSEEQARIARELHDVIAHGVSVIVVQAGAAADVFDERPDRARAALDSIEHTGRDALAELRRLLGAVRPDPEADPTHPPPGLDRIEELARSLKASGLEVVVRREGAPAPVPAGVELSAYRIVQEALTNTLRHAQATRAEVIVRYEAAAVEIEVRDNGRGDAPANGASGGHGLMGMRERVSLYGGTLETGAAAGGGYRVHARLPAAGER